ncbi:MAG: SRPBCC family protein [Rhodoplanes sp.]|uniref:SRPBCC family protein n=1 Tax=Rhodoplanes sp. TaxID=1968906 RepID=UPI001851D2D1|nr:SRPBCC family protein [Rhodoplanes sp.]NVO14282.1 SRPBCC family protein [Rhodoplanes sp.]
MLEGIIITAAVLAGVMVVVAAFASTRPDHFKIARSTTIAAPSAAIYPLIADLHRFNTWNPFALKDPYAKGHYEGPPNGVGAGYVFDGSKSGTGRIDVVDTKPDAAVIMRLLMTRPMAADNRIAFTLEPQGDATRIATRVTWAMEGAVPFVGKLVSLVLDCETMVGPDFEAGLASLKALAEGSAPLGPGRTAGGT